MRPADVPLLTRAKSWYDGLPYCTRIVTVLLLVVFAVGELTGYNDVANFCLSGLDAVVGLQVYRLLTAPVFHVGLLHIGFNLLTFVPLGHSMERSEGTIQFAYLVCQMMILPGLLYVGLSYAVALSGMYAGAVRECAVGFSGVLFGLIVVDNASNGAPKRSVFGFLEIPAAVYPWALLFVVQMIPGVSFLGHLSGLLAGYMYALGLLRFLQPSRQTLMELEGSHFAMQFLTRSPSFMMVPGPSLPTTTYGTSADAAGSPSAGGGGAGGWLAGVTRLFQRDSAAAGGADVEAGAPLLPGGAAASAEKAFVGKAHQLGGASPGGSGAQAPAAIAAAAAAAAAAESRMARTPGSTPSTPKM